MRFVFNREKSRCTWQTIGWCRGRLCSAIFEIRHDIQAEYHHLVTSWKATKEEEQSYAENV